MGLGKSEIKPEIRLAVPKELRKSEQLFLAIHRHEYGMTHVVFACSASMAEIKALLGEDESGSSPVIEFAERLGLQYEPDKGEELSVDEFDPEVTVITLPKVEKQQVETVEIAL